MSHSQPASTGSFRLATRHCQNFTMPAWPAGKALLVCSPQLTTREGPPGLVNTVCLPHALQGHLCLQGTGRSSENLSDCRGQQQLSWSSRKCCDQQPHRPSSAGLGLCLTKHCSLASGKSSSESAPGALPVGLRGHRRYCSSALPPTCRPAHTTAGAGPPCTIWWPRQPLTLLS